MKIYDAMLKVMLNNIEAENEKEAKELIHSMIKGCGGKVEGKILLLEG